MRRALAFLTPLPLPAGGAWAPTPAALGWFPLAGALLGVAVGGLWWAAAQVWPTAAAAAVAVAADLALTGLLHIDGLVDAADGLLPPLDRDDRLRVMADPHAGAFGVTTVVAFLLLRWTAFSALRPSPLLVAGLWSASRSAMAVAVRSLPYVRRGGLGEPFTTPLSAAEARGSSPIVVGLVGVVLALALAIAGAAVHGAAGVAGVAVGAGAVVALARRRIGGCTGDVLGAAGVVGETVGLLVAAARW